MSSSDNLKNGIPPTKVGFSVCYQWCFEKHSTYSNGDFLDIPQHLHRIVMWSRRAALEAQGFLRPAAVGLGLAGELITHAIASRGYGRRDIARFLSGVPLSAIPWREYTIN